MNRMIERIRTDAFSLTLAVLALLGTAFVMTVMAIMVDNMTRIL